MSCTNWPEVKKTITVITKKGDYLVNQGIKTGILSYGMSGRVFHAPFLEVSERFELSAVVERSKKAAAQDYPNIVSYGSVDELLADESIELVVVNTPNDTHVEFAKKALEAGKHVLIEKPFAPTVEEAKMLFELGRQHKRYVLPYHNRRFDSDFLALKYILEKNFVGRPIELHLRFDRYRQEIGPKVFKETKRPAAGVMYDLGSHLLDQTLSLFGKPRSVTKLQGAYRSGSKVDDYGHLMLNYVDGLNVFITTSLLVADPQASFVLHGTEGSFVKHRTDVQESQLLAGMKPDNSFYGIEQEGGHGLLTIRNEEGKLEKISVPSERGSYPSVFEEVYQTIRLHKPYYVTEDQIVWQLEILAPSTKRKT